MQFERRLSDAQEKFLRNTFNYQRDEGNLTIFGFWSLPQGGEWNTARALWRQGFVEREHDSRYARVRLSPKGMQFGARLWEMYWAAQGDGRVAS